MLKKFLNLTVGKKILVLVGGLFLVTTLAGALNSSPTNPVSTAPQAVAPIVEVKELSERVPIAAGEETREDSSMPSGQTKVVQEAVAGEELVTYEVRYENNVEKSRIKKTAVTTKNPINKITAKGTYVALSPAPKPASNCDPNYSPCIPKVSYDLDCADISRSVTVVGYDVHGFDRDNDGAGCESY